MTNRLKEETSPYLLQHQNNPVHWRGWNPETLDQAKQTNKPILLSIGYAACHWCHVMAHESFENDETAQLMNQMFINIKVDREERPDLDAIYQKALGLMGQHGGWPLTMFLTPEGEPFYGGTYFPPISKWGRSSFSDVLKTVNEAWVNRPEQVMAETKSLLRKLRHNPQGKGEMPANLDALDYYAQHMVNAVDPVYGGLEGAPKFPHFGFFDRLWRAGLKGDNQEAKDAVILTLDRMFNGGIYDHLGGGLMRYSTDETWLVPHFEKMLYDNAQAIDLLTLLWQSEQNPFHGQKTAEIIGWVLREMIGENGAFAATLDADDPEGEGHFYTWTKAEIDHILGPDSAKIFAHSYDVTCGGNWEGRTILHRQDHSTPETLLAEARAKLFHVREGRVHPKRDDKILADWNGMMITAMAQAAFVFHRQDWLMAAIQAYAAVKTHMSLDDHRLAHSMCKGQVSQLGILDDLAHMARAALMLFEVTGKTEYKTDALNWARAAHRHHHDKQHGGYFQNHLQAQDIIAWLKPVHDNAVPAGSGILLEVFAKLWTITNDRDWLELAHKLMDFLGPMIPNNFPHMSACLAGLEVLLDPVVIHVAGSDDFLQVIAETPLPTRVLIQAEGPVAAHVCRHGICSEIVFDEEDLRHLLT